MPCFHRHHRGLSHLQIQLLSLFLLSAVTRLVVCDVETAFDELSLEEQKRSAAVEDRKRGGRAERGDGGKDADGEPKYELVVALIEKYLKEKASRKLENENIQTPVSDSSDSGCGADTELNGAESGSIKYPRSGTYLNNERCQWTIRAPTDKAIELTVRRISVEATEECRWDRLQVFDNGITSASAASNGSRLITTLCGFVLPVQPYVTTGNLAVVRFASDDTVSYGGFQIDFRPISRGGAEEQKPEKINKASSIEKSPPSSSSSSSAQCPSMKELKDPVGFIKFPLSGEYEDNLSCKWRIVTSPGKVIQLRVTSIDIEAPDECHNCCWFDWLLLYDGRTENASTAMAKLCGTETPKAPFTTSSNAALVVFRSNGRIGEEGFEINYQTFQKDKTKSKDFNVCSGQVNVIREPSGSLQSPGLENKKYPENVRCRWRFVAPAGQNIRVKFQSLDIESDVGCVYDSLSFYDGYNRSAPLIGRFCGHQPPSDVVTVGSTLLVSFETDDSMSEGGFSFTWAFIDLRATSNKDMLACEGQTLVLEQNEGVVSSPNFGKGQEYPNSVSCSWHIISNPNTKVSLRFETFSLEPPLLEAECYDSVSIYDGADDTKTSLGNYCGDYSPADLLSSTNHLYITFKSDKSTKAPGFLIRFSAKVPEVLAESDCGVSDVMPKIYNRIVGGVEAAAHSWPWQVSIKYSGYNWKHWCGGSLLFPHWIVTAAHCLHGNGPASNFRVVLGEHNQLLNDGTEQELEVQEIIMHENYDSDTNDNDIALFRLPRDVLYNRNIKPICLPKNDIGENVLCIITGWGDTKSTGNESILNQVFVPVVSRIQCNQPSWYAGQVTDNMFCAGYPEGRKDSCQGDSGGPLTCLWEGRWRLFGLTSFGYDCAISKHPGVYTRVTRYLQWLESKMKS